MNAEQLMIISNISKEINISPENVLFEENDPCDYLYIIVEGEIDIVKALGSASEETVATLGPPASFGEMAVFGNEGRSASARAGADSTLLGIEKDHLLELIREQPALSIEIIRRLASIIRNQDQARVAAHHDD
jgi:CRP-like cAMP-binding protein